MSTVFNYNSLNNIYYKDISKYFIDNLNNDIYESIIDEIYKTNRIYFIENCKIELIKKIEGLCNRKMDYYKNDETGDLSMNQTLFYNWNYYLYKDIKENESKCIYRF